MTWRNAILIGDVRTRLSEIPDGAVQTVVTSPPYWGLRDYGTATWLGGDEDCDHKQPVSFSKSTLNAGPVYHEASISAQAQPYRDTCGKCGATRVDAQIGLETTPEAYVCGMVELFREVRRTLADDGTLWLNLGDSYANNPASAVNRNGMTGSLNNGQSDFPVRTGTRGSQQRQALPLGLKPKDLVGIPWMVAFALRADGWYLRSDIIWSKPNPMPESVTDRPTKAHEYIFLLSKSARYYYDHEAIREPLAPGELERHRPPRGEVNAGYAAGIYHSSPSMASHFTPFASNPNGRNKRSVWEIPTQPYAEAHFATYPPELIKPCILAGSREGDVVLDPFLGSGTTALVALKAGRDFVGVELNPTYAEMAERRIAPVRSRLL